MMDDPHAPVFGAAPEGVVCRPRVGAYAIIRGTGGRVAAVRATVGGRAGCWLPGGGAESGESPEETVVREIREELGRDARLLGRAGEAIQYFYAAGDGCWYRMHAVFFTAELVGEPAGPAEHEPCWIDPAREAESFLHACHAWAASRS
jgi:ADP-ribose pyrophosphatase YjhB (NUDIX family)